MIWDIDLIFGMWVYWWVTDQVLISFRLNDFGLIYAPWTFSFGQIFSCHHALRYWLDFWYLELQWLAFIILTAGTSTHLYFSFFFLARFEFLSKWKHFLYILGRNSNIQFIYFTKYDIAFPSMWTYYIYPQMCISLFPCSCS